jgi:hypothetical protein
MFPTELFPVPIIPIKYRLEPLSLGLRSRAGSIFIPSSELVRPGFLKGFSTP